MPSGRSNARLSTPPATTYASPRSSPGVRAQALDAAERQAEALGGLSEAEPHAVARRDVLQLVREERAVAGLVVRQVQRARERRDRVQRHFHRARLVAAQQPVRDAQFGEHLARCRRTLDLLLGPEQLQVARGLLVVERVQLAQRADLLLAVEGEPLHARLVAGEPFGAALGEPAPDPVPQGQVRGGPEDDGRLGLEEVGGDLARHARLRPRRDVGRRHDAGVGEARLLGHAGTALDHGDVHACPAQEVGGAHADDAGADHDDVHGRCSSSVASGAHCSRAPPAT